MANEYITHYEIYDDGKVVGFGNQSISAAGPLTASDLYSTIRDNAAKEYGCLPDAVRILGVFKV